MSLESTAGKNPVNHVGKLYQLTAGRIAQAVVAGAPDLEACECVMASAIGDPVDRPQVVNLHVKPPPGATPVDFRPVIEEIVALELARISGLWREVIGTGLTVF
jgi:S-adenosylmethionine synthetase